MKVTLTLFGIIETIKGGKNTKVKYIDKYETSDLFEGYEKYKEFWKSTKNKVLNYKDFWNLIYHKDNDQSKLKDFI